MSEIQVSETILPAPEKDIPILHELIYVFDPTDKEGYYPIQWEGGQIDLKWLRDGVIYRNEENVKKVVQWFRSTFGKKENNY